MDADLTSMIETTPLTQQWPLDILLEDGPLIALNKPAGLLTQGVPDALPTLEGQIKSYLKQKLAKPGNVYLGVPHRLDRPVSGIVIFAKNSKAAARLAEQFRERSIRKTYLAVTESVPATSEGSLIDWLLKDAASAHVTVVTEETEGAKRAVLDYEVIAVRDGRALVKIELHTGRMHQIRVQFASRGWSIEGDTQYGAAGTGYGAKGPGTAFGDGDLRTSAIALHAWQLVLKHPVRYDRVRLNARPPAAWNRFGFIVPTPD